MQNLLIVCIVLLTWVNCKVCTQHTYMWMLYVSVVCCVQVPRLQALWEYDMRSTRSNSMSSSSSQESADSAYRTISNPGTPRSPYQPRTAAAAAAAAPDARKYSPYRSSPLLTTSDSVNPAPSRAAPTDQPIRSQLQRTSPVLQTALSLPPLLGQEAWFHTPRRSILRPAPASTATSTAVTTPVSTAALPRTVSIDTSVSEDIDVESLETDVTSQTAYKHDTPNSNNHKVFKLKKSFLERFSPEPEQTSSDRDATASPTRSLPERSQRHELQLPARSKSISPRPCDRWRCSRGADERAVETAESEQSSAAQLQTDRKPLSPPQLTSYPGAALMYQYAAMQQLQHMRSLQQTLSQ